MADARTISCRECGHHFRTFRRNTKYCRVCRLLKDLPYVGDSRRSCALCGEEFSPLHIRDRCCGTDAPTVRADQQILCSKCGETRTSVSGDLRICGTCARDPQHRIWFYKALKLRREWQREHAGPPITDTPPAQSHHVDPDGGL